MILHRPSLKTTTRCHSVFSLRSPVVLSRQLSDVATLRFAIGRPSWVRRISGSLPRLPIRITLLTLPAMILLRFPCPEHYPPKRASLRRRKCDQNQERIKVISPRLRQAHSCL